MNSHEETIEELMSQKTAHSSYLMEELTAVLSGNTQKYQDDSPSGELEMGEQVLGTLEDSVARALWNFSRKIHGNIKSDCQLLASLDPGDPMMINKIFRTVDDADDIATVAMKLFWTRVHISFPQAHRPELNIGVRNGWKVVVMKSNSDILSLLGYLRHLIQGRED